MYGIIETFKANELVGKKVIPFVGPCAPTKMMYPETWGSEADPVSETEVMEKWKIFFKRKEVPFFIKCTKTDRSLTLWKEEVAWEKKPVGTVCVSAWFERGN